MGTFEEQFKLLNAEQKKAVETTEGPVLVIAGPGTGKTQLLSMRVANILRKNDISPSNILCLTFTDNAARNMRDRLQDIIGQPAYHVAIHTFHSFGSEIISKYPDYFTDRQMLQQIEELGRFELMREIFEDLPHDNPLSVKVGEDYIFINDTLNIINWLRQNALKPEELRQILSGNKEFMLKTGAVIAETFETTPLAKNLPKYQKLLKHLQNNAKDVALYGFPDYGAAASEQLADAVTQITTEGRYAPAITEWRKQWCKKNSKGKYVFKDAEGNLRKMEAVADVYENLLDTMADRGLFDFDDMIIEAVHAIETNDELRFSLQERYQYLLVDEFQDTNKAQLRLLAALGSNPVHEGKPNIMAVGDDDQAIYSFQGAEVSNMVAFLKMYPESSVFSLKENYRSDQDILSVSQLIAAQIEKRLNSEIPDIDKNLMAMKEFNNRVIDHLRFSSELAQYEWIASEIESLIAGGTAPEEIAVIAPRHKYLERLMPYLGNRKIPVAYERRENILESPIIAQLITMAELVQALSENKQDDVDRLISRVLSYEFWGIDTNLMIEISLECYQDHKRWLDVLSKHPNKHIREIASWFTDLARHANTEPMEYVLDKLIGTSETSIDSEYDDLLVTAKISGEKEFKSPYREYHFPEERYDTATDSYLTLLGQLSSLRHNLRQWQPHRALYIKDFLDFCSLHRRANIKIIDSNPHTQTTKAVQVMTAYKAKGLEFEVVFVINGQDEVWGPTAKSRGSRIALPRNLPIAPAGESNDDKLRLLYVGMTRAKHTLHLTSYTHSLENKLSPGLSYLIDSSHTDMPLHPLLSPKTIEKPAGKTASEILATDWAYRYRQVIADKPELLEPILKNYMLSATHLNNFLDVKKGGPQYFLIHNLLRFPEAISPSAAYGDAIHKTLQWTAIQKRKSDRLPSIEEILSHYNDFLSRTHLEKTEMKNYKKKGEEALKIYIANRGKEFLSDDKIEHNFNYEGVVINNTPVTGKIDRLRMDTDHKAVVTDFKTGNPARSWMGKDDFEKIKLHKYRQQLMFYKLLVENSASFSGRIEVKTGELEFIEPDEDKKLVDNLSVEFEAAEINRFIRLVSTVWNRISSLDFPDISGYSPDIKGILKFEEDLLSD